MQHPQRDAGAYPKREKIVYLIIVVTAVHIFLTKLSGVEFKIIGKKIWTQYHLIETQIYNG